jgi:hypothetical protein
MTSLETMTTLDLDRSVFDSNDMRILSAAFERAWAFVAFDPRLEGLEKSRRQSELARCLMTLEKFGETNPTSLANAGIAMLRARHQRRPLINRYGEVTIIRNSVKDRPEN